MFPSCLPENPAILTACGICALQRVTEIGNRVRMALLKAHGEMLTKLFHAWPVIKIPIFQMNLPSGLWGNLKGGNDHRRFLGGKPFTPPPQKVEKRIIPTPLLLGPLADPWKIHK